MPAAGEPYERWRQLGIIATDLKFGREMPGSMRGLFGSCLRQLKEDRRLRAVVSLAVFGELVLFALHIAHVLAGSRFDPGNLFLRAGFKERNFSLQAEGGYGEMFEYLLLALIIVAFARLALTLRRPVYFAFLFIFIYYLADDSLEIHEDLGGFLTHWLDLQPAFGLRGQDFGELATWALFGTPLLGFLAFALWRSAGLDRSAGMTLTAWFFVLAFFGGAVDMMSSITRDGGAAHRIIALIEDGGEMAVIAVILALSAAVPGYLSEEKSAKVEQR